MRRVLPLIACACLAFAPAPLPRSRPRADARAALQKVQGEWVLVHASTEGKPDGNVLQGLVFSGSTFRMLGPVGYRGDWTFTMNPKTGPKSLDMVVPGGGVLIEAVYSLEGDTLRICSHDTGKKRPRDLSGSGPSESLCVFKRKKP
jgi:uncharacterized protein (TIGR03067 family)